MARLRSPTDFGTMGSPEAFQRFVTQFIGDAANIVNGKIEFDLNIQTQTKKVSFTAANTDTAITHNLNKTGVNYIVVGKNQSCDVWTGNSVATKNTIYLQCSQVANVTLVLF